MHISCTHISCAQVRPGAAVDEALPHRKSKGRVDKRREDGVEVVYMPGGSLLASLAEGQDESPTRIADMQKVLRQ